VIICICNTTGYRIDTGSDRIKKFYLWGEGKGGFACV
jgi:hypothetical protein